MTTKRGARLGLPASNPTPEQQQSDEAVKATAEREQRDDRRRQLLTVIRQAYEEEDKAFEGLGWALQLKGSSPEGYDLWCSMREYFARRADISQQKARELIEMGDD